MLNELQIDGARPVSSARPTDDQLRRLAMRLLVCVVACVAVHVGCACWGLESAKVEHLECGGECGAATDGFSYAAFSGT